MKACQTAFCRSGAVGESSVQATPRERGLRPERVRGHDVDECVELAQVVLERGARQNDATVRGQGLKVDGHWEK